MVSMELQLIAKGVSLSKTPTFLGEDFPY